MADKSVRVAANTNNKQLETVNVASTQPPNGPKHKKHQQVTAAQAAAKPHLFETYQDSGGTVKGLRTIHIPGYAAPN